MQNIEVNDDTETSLTFIRRAGDREQLSNTKLMNCRTESNRNDRTHASGCRDRQCRRLCVHIAPVDTARVAVVQRLARPSDGRWQQRHIAAAGMLASPARPLSASPTLCRTVSKAQTFRGG